MIFDKRLQCYQSNPGPVFISQVNVASPDYGPRAKFARLYLVCYPHPQTKMSLILQAITNTK